MKQVCGFLALCWAGDYRIYVSFDLTPEDLAFESAAGRAEWLSTPTFAARLLRGAVAPR